MFNFDSLIHVLILKSHVFQLFVVIMFSMLFIFHEVKAI